MNKVEFSSWKTWSSALKTDDIPNFPIVFLQELNVLVFYGKLPFINMHVANESTMFLLNSIVLLKFLAVFFQNKQRRMTYRNYSWIRQVYNRRIFQTSTKCIDPSTYAIPRQV